jgi:hypothetical protein
MLDTLTRHQNGQSEKEMAFAKTIIEELKKQKEWTKENFKSYLDELFGMVETYQSKNNPSEHIGTATENAPSDKELELLEKKYRELADRKNTDAS